MMVASRTKNRLKDGSTIMRMYYSCGNFRSKGSSVCSANSLRKEEAEQYILNRLKQVLTRKTILRNIVRKINHRKKSRIKPLRQELEHIEKLLRDIEKKKSKYFDLYEMDQMDKGIFSNRIEELNEDADKMNTKMEEIKQELDHDNGEPVSYEVVKALIGRFNELLESSPLEQRKTLLQLVIKKITVTERKQIGHLELAFDRATQKHFLDLAPSEPSGGAFVLPKAKLPHALTVVL